MEGDAAGVGDEEVPAWTHGREELSDRLRPHCARRDAPQRARPSLRARVRPVARQHGWPLAEIAGEGTPDGMQPLLGRAVWDVDLGCDALQRYVVAQRGEAEGLLILDQTSVPKKGTTSAGVGRQDCGSLGQGEHWQGGVLLAYAGSAGCAFIDRALSLPKAWTEDPERRREAGIPAAVSLLTKPESGRQLLARVLESGTPVTWVLAEEIDGGDERLRACGEARRCRYVLAVAAHQDGWVGWEQRRVDAVIRDRAARAWSRLSGGKGRKGPRIYDWAPSRRTSPVAGWDGWALCRRAVAAPQDLASCLVVVPSATPLAAIVRAAGSRWHREEAIAEATGEGGLDHDAVRRWQGWYRHLTLALLAQACLVVTRAIAAPDASTGGMTAPNGVRSLAAFRQRRGRAR